MLDTVLISLLIVAICIALLGVKVFFVKGGKFRTGTSAVIKQCVREVLGVPSRRTGKHRRNPVSPLTNWKKP